MVYQPAIGVGGYGGWKILESTVERQKAAFERSPGLARDIEYFRDNVSNARTAEALIKDRRLLSVALGAFGLGEEINKRAFIQKALEGGTETSDAFAVRINDERYREFAEAFGYGNSTGGSNVLLSSFKEDVIARFKSLEFERAVGDSDTDMRLAMNFKRSIGRIAASDNADRTGWLRVMGQRPLREVLSTALGLPTSIAQLDIDRQVEIFEEKAQKVFGGKSVSIFTDESLVEEAVRRFFVIRQTQNGPSASTPGFGALSLLQNSGFGNAGISNLLLSQT